MVKRRFSFSKIPGWLIMIVTFGMLYFTGLHTEVLGKIQSLFLYTGIIKPDIPNTEDLNSIQGKSKAAPSLMAGKGLQMKMLSGETYKMEDLYGKTIFLNVWATWCPPCIAEMPNIQKLYEKVQSDDIVFLMLSVDKDKNKAFKFIEIKGYTFPVFVTDGPIPDDLKFTVIPTTFVISPEGEIVVRKEGMANYNTDEFIGFLNKLNRQ